MYRIYTRKLFLKGRSFLLTAVPEDLDVKGDFLEIYKGEGYKILLSTSLEDLSYNAEVKVIWLPDEQSISTIFLFGEKRRVADLLIKAAKEIRIGISKTICFKDGCRKPASYYAIKNGSAWYACSKEHMSDMTTQGVPLNESDYKPILLEADRFISQKSSSS
jgi:hypothetical protein